MRPNPSAPPSGDDWTGLCSDAIDASAVHHWLVRDDCGAIVVFSGTARDHAGDRSGVESLTYEAWESRASERIDSVVTELRRRWPDVRAVTVLHRTGEVPVGSAAVIVGVSAPHRSEAFEAARYGIDAVKAAVPIWKRERHADGEDWGLEGAEMVDPADVNTAVAS
ncbi:MAG: molybdenum cofactor biosynthesis protein MoaE [Microthrixaceae bacterium]